MPTSLTFLPRVEGTGATILVADDSFKLRTIDVATLTCTRTVLGPTYGGPLSLMVPFAGGAFMAYATPEKVVGLAALPLDGDPGRAMVGRCRLTASKSVLQAPMVSALEATIC